MIADVESSIVCKKLYTLAPATELSKKSIYKLAADIMFALLNLRKPFPGSAFVVVVENVYSNEAPVNTPGAP